MKLPRLPRLMLVPLGLVLLPPVLWVLVVALAPTDCARQKIVARLSAATGRAVRLHTLSVGLCGGVYLDDLEVAAPRQGDDPWLKVAHARIDVNGWQLLTGHVEPSEVRVVGVTLRVLRRQDGSLELSDLLGPAAPTPAPSATDSGPAGFAGLEVVIQDATIHVIDESTQTRLDFAGVEGRATWAGPRLTIPKVQGTLNGGPFELAAQLDQSRPAPAFEGQLRASGVTLTEGMTALGYLVPVLSGTADGSLQGKLALNLYARGQGATCDAVRTSLVGQGSVALDPIQVEGSELLAELSRVTDLSPTGRGHVGAVKTDFVIKDGRIATDNLTLDVGKVPVVLSGWTDFDGKLDYRLKTDALTEKLPGKARDLLSELDINLNNLTALKVQGSVDAMVVTVDGIPLREKKVGGHDGARVDDRQHYKEIGRRLRDKLLR